MAPIIPANPKSATHTNLPSGSSQPAKARGKYPTKMVEKHVRRLVIMTQLQRGNWKFPRNRTNVLALNRNNLHHVYRVLSMDYTFAKLKRVVDVWEDQGQGKPLDFTAFDEIEGWSLPIRHVVAGYLLAREDARDFSNHRMDQPFVLKDHEELLIELRRGLRLMA